MSLMEARLELAVDVVGRALRDREDAPASERMAAFRRSYDVVRRLEAGADADWTEETLDAAWDLVRDAYDDGGPLEQVLADLTSAHETVVEVSQPPARQPRRRRRDA